MLIARQNGDGSMDKIRCPFGEHAIHPAELPERHTDLVGRAQAPLPVVLGFHDRQGDRASEILCSKAFRRSRCHFSLLRHLWHRLKANQLSIVKSIRNDWSPTAWKFGKYSDHCMHVKSSCRVETLFDLTACKLRTVLRSHNERSTVRSLQAAEQHSQSAIRCSPSLEQRCWQLYYGG
jgi:hypothetical protein